LRMPRLEQVRAASRSQAPSAAHPWRCGVLNEKRELARIEAGRATRVSARLERVAVEVAKAEAEAAPVDRDVHAIVAGVVRSAAGPRRLALDAD
jgi:hypothetical protein